MPHEAKPSRQAPIIGLLRKRRFDCVKVRAKQSSHDLVRKKERRSAVIESEQVHMTIQILDFAQDHRLLAESAFTLLVTHRPQQLDAAATRSRVRSFCHDLCPIRRDVSIPFIFRAVDRVESEHRPRHARLYRQLDLARQTVMQCRPTRLSAATGLRARESEVEAFRYGLTTPSGALLLLERLDVTDDRRDPCVDPGLCLR